MTTYKVIKYQDANEFLAHTQSELENDEIINTFPLWICDVKTSADNNENQSYAALFQNDQLAYVLVCADGYSHVGWCGQRQQHIDTGNIHLVDAIKELLLTGAALTQKTTLNGYSPVVNVFDRLRKTFSASSSSTFTFGSALSDTNSNDLDTALVPAIPAPALTLGPLYNLWSYQINNTRNIIWTDTTRQLGQRATLRQAVWMDLPLLAKWGDAFIRDCGLTDGDVWHRCAAVIKEGFAYFWCLDDGVPAAMIWKRRALRHGISLAYVYTPNENRGRGYAATMVAQITQYLLDKEGYHYVTLLMDGARDPVKNMYTSVGYQLVGSMARLTY